MSPNWSNIAKCAQSRAVAATLTAAYLDLKIKKESQHHPLEPEVLTAHCQRSRAYRELASREKTTLFAAVKLSLKHEPSRELTEGFDADTNR